MRCFLLLIVVFVCLSHAKWTMFRRDSRHSGRLGAVVSEVNSFVVLFFCSLTSRSMERIGRHL